MVTAWSPCAAPRPVPRPARVPGREQPGDWYLNILATHPDWQRQGLGGAMLSTVLAQADADGLACYLETETPANVADYRHHGVDVRSEWDLAADGVAGPHMWGMYRPAR